MTWDSYAIIESWVSTIMNNRDGFPDFANLTEREIYSALDASDDILKREWDATVNSIREMMRYAHPQFGNTTTQWFGWSNIPWDGCPSGWFTFTDVNGMLFEILPRESVAVSEDGRPPIFSGVPPRDCIITMTSFIDDTVNRIGIHSVFRCGAVERRVILIPCAPREWMDGLRHIPTPFHIAVI